MNFEGWFENIIWLHASGYIQMCPHTRSTFLVLTMEIDVNGSPLAKYVTRYKTFEFSLVVNCIFSSSKSIKRQLALKLTGIRIELVQCSTARE